MEFFRKVQISTLLAKPLSDRQGLLFSLSLGCSAPLDPLTGMTVSLPLMDAWLASVKQQMEAQLSEVGQTATETLYLLGVQAMEILQKKADGHAEVLTLRLQTAQGEELVWTLSGGWQQVLSEEVELTEYRGRYQRVQVQCYQAYPGVTVRSFHRGPYGSMEHLLQELHGLKNDYLRIKVLLLREELEIEI